MTFSDDDLTPEPKGRNRCQCLFCEDIIESLSRWDHVTCLCGAIFTDGGSEYTHRGWGPPVHLDHVKRTEMLHSYDFFPILDLP